MSIAISKPVTHYSYYVWLFVSENAIVNACSSTTLREDSNKIPALHRVSLDDPSTNKNPASF